ncbi:MAG: DUF5132 domain-containing protein [Desulfomonilaceae bacterium]
MSMWDYSPKGGLWTGVAVGLGLAAAPSLIPLAWSTTRSLLKAALKGGFTVYERAHDLASEMVQGAADLVSEASSEVHNELSVPRGIILRKGSKPTELS